MSYVRSPPHDFESNGRALAAGVAHAFKAEDAARMRELDRLCAAGYGTTDPKRIPLSVLHPPQEEAMAETCSKCGKEVRRSRYGELHEKCKECRVKAGEYIQASRVKEEPAPAPEASPDMPRPKVPGPKVTLPKASPAKKPSAPELYGPTVQELVDLRTAINAELADRIAKIEAEREELLRATGAIGCPETSAA